MTRFVVSHNLQVNSKNVPVIGQKVLAEGLLYGNDLINSVDAIEHPHWVLSMKSDLAPLDMANDLVRSWKNLRAQLGHDTNHIILALGGRKDSQSKIGSPLQEGDWGVDLIETIDEKSFLESIGWDELKSGRPSDSVFEVVLRT